MAGFVRAGLVLGLFSPIVAACGGGVNSSQYARTAAPVEQDPKRHLTVDGRQARTMVNTYRAKHGLHPLALDPALNTISRQTAEILAGKDKLKTSMHTPRALARRLDSAGYVNAAGAENLGGGYLTLSDAFEGWKASPDHNKNLLNPHVTHMGIALVVRETGRFKSFWVLIMSRPLSAGRPEFKPGLMRAPG